MDANYNLSGLKARVKARLKDIEFSDEDVERALNDAYFEIMGETHYPFLERRSDFTRFKGGELDLPKDFEAIISLMQRSQKGSAVLEYMPYEEWFAKTASSKANTFTTFADKVYFMLPSGCPLTCDENTCDTDLYRMTLLYLASPKPLTNDSDVPAIPYEFGEALMLLALSRCEQLRDNFDYAQIYENKANDLLTNLTARYNVRALGNKNVAKLPVRIQSF